MRRFLPSLRLRYFKCQLCSTSSNPTIIDEGIRCAPVSTSTSTTSSEFETLKIMRDKMAGTFDERLRATLREWKQRNYDNYAFLRDVRIDSSSVSTNSSTAHLKTIVETNAPFIMRHPISPFHLRHTAGLVTSIHVEAFRPNLRCSLINVREMEMPCVTDIIANTHGDTVHDFTARAGAQVVDDEFILVTCKLHTGGPAGLTVLWRTSLFKADVL
eukprot:Tbor_TRINITY_DN5963_c0_g3::TRINITY_DN5963_c0_g3_i1::g.19294::m.19294